MTRIGNWIQTYSGVEFYPADPRPEDVNIEDIAHALSNICRFGGHSKAFYSVAEHCVLLSRLVPRSHRYAALLHDATEAYTLDLPRPIKQMLPVYRSMEHQVWLAICRKFELEVEHPACVKEADLVMLATEGRQALNPPGALGWTEPLPPPADIFLRFWTPNQAKERFLVAFKEYANDPFCRGLGATRSC